VRIRHQPTYVSFEESLDVLKLHLRVDLDGVNLVLVGEDRDTHLESCQRHLEVGVRTEKVVAVKSRGVEM
jgi:hypothetical protein